VTDDVEHEELEGVAGGNGSDLDWSDIDWSKIEW